MALVENENPSNCPPHGFYYEPKQWQFPWTLSCIDRGEELVASLRNEVIGQVVTINIFITSVIIAGF